MPVRPRYAQDSQMRFSERNGHKPIRQLIQLVSMDEPLRNGLWNLLTVYCWEDAERQLDWPSHGYYYYPDDPDKVLYDFCERCWLRFFKRTLDTLHSSWTTFKAELREYFFKCEWYEVYDFIEFVAQNYGQREFQMSFIQRCNQLLEEEMSAYRFVDGVIVPITDTLELEAIELALAGSRDPVVEHLGRALELLSDRNTPDYRNSMKESISAVESLVSIILKPEKGTKDFSKLIRRLDDQIGLHPSLIGAFDKLYGYTSDAGGIRHALKDADNVDFHDAKLMLVLCTSFINFVEGKLQRVG